MSRMKPYVLFVMLLLVPTIVFGFGSEFEMRKRQSCEWNYDDGTPEGPAHWGMICSNAYPICASGQKQSPIDVITSDASDNQYSARPLKLTYTAETNVVLTNNGHTLVVGTPSKGIQLTIPDVGSYDIAQFHMHFPSEHTLNGAIYPLELHMVHQDAAGKYAVLGFFIAEGPSNEVLAPIVQALASVKAEGQNTTLSKVDLQLLVNSAFSYFSYDGSFTTPPCTEGVAWLLSDTPIYLSPSQIQAIKDTLKGVVPEGNARPIQPLNSRVVTYYELPSSASLIALSVASIFAIVCQLFL